MARKEKKIKYDIGIDVFNVTRFALCQMLTSSQRPGASDQWPYVTPDTRNLKPY
jgi:hypothetical protein